MEVNPEMREDIRAELARKVDEKQESQKTRIIKFTLLGIGIGAVIGIIMLAFPGFYETLMKIHESLSAPRYSFYVLIGSILFVEFMRMTWVESAKARSKRLIPLTSPETEIWVKEKPLIGLKLPFTGKEVKSRRIKPHIVETELGWRVYPNKSLLSPQWNGEIYFIPYDSIHGYGNTRIISAKKPSKPTYYETDPVTGEAIPVYVWEPIDLGEEKYMKAQKEIAYLEAENRILQEYAAKGYELAKTISQIPQEFFEELSNRGFEKAKQILEIIGKGFFSEVGKIKKEEISAILEAIKKDREAW
ncbi:MAG: hypothetical protein H0Z18_10865 [Thermococcus sp.]|uniref:hypothetical protein n=1 Tax=Thermococcus sp. TaxID=35749 RepID=UPI001D3ABD56|nr:hypothetical protein [Thermococcus sp.]MBO8175747.1 hypothetical protein [Thermococcus sp.]